MKKYKILEIKAYYIPIFKVCEQSHFIAEHGKMSVACLCVCAVQPLFGGWPHQVEAASMATGLRLADRAGYLPCVRRLCLVPYECSCN